MDKSISHWGIMNQDVDNAIGGYDDHEMTEEMFANAKPAKEALTEIYGAEFAEKFLNNNRAHVEFRGTFMGKALKEGALQGLPGGAALQPSPNQTTDPKCLAIIHKASPITSFGFTAIRQEVISNRLLFSATYDGETWFRITTEAYIAQAHEINAPYYEMRKAGYSLEYRTTQTTDRELAPLYTPIIVWQFHEAPLELQELSTNGGDEDWLAILPPSNPIPPIWMDSSLYGCCSVYEYPHPTKEGYIICIGSHA